MEYLGRERKNKQGNKINDKNSYNRNQHNKFSPRPFFGLYFQLTAMCFHDIIT